MSLWDPHAALRPWCPESFKAEFGSQAPDLLARYVVVEEIADDEVRCVVSAWPSVEGDGQLVFADPEQDAEYVDSRETIEILLSDRRIVRVSDELASDPERQLVVRVEEQLQERTVEVGDVYAIVAPLPGYPNEPPGGGPGGGLFENLREVPLARIYDISTDARIAATATYASAVAGTLSEQDALVFLDDEDEDNPQKDDGSPTPAPDGGGSPTGGGDSESASSLQEEVDAVASEHDQQRRQVASVSVGA